MFSTIIVEKNELLNFTHSSISSDLMTIELDGMFGF